MSLNGASNYSLTTNGDQRFQSDQELDRIRRYADYYFVDQAQSLPGESQDTLVPILEAKRNDFKGLGKPGRFVPVSSGASCSTQQYVYYPDRFRITNSPETPLQLAPNAYRYNSIPQIGCQNNKVVEFEPYGTHGTPPSDPCIAGNMYGILERKSLEMAARWHWTNNRNQARDWRNQAAEFKELQRLYVLQCMRNQRTKNVKAATKTLERLTPVSRTMASLDRDTINFISKAADKNRPLFSEASLDLFSKQRSSFPGLVDAGVQDDSNRVKIPNIITQKSIVPGGPKVVPDASEVFPDDNPQTFTQANTDDKDNTVLIVAGVAVAALVAFNVFKKGKK